MSEANNKVLKRQLEVLISILLHKKAVRKKRTALQSVEKVQQKLGFFT